MTVLGDLAQATDVGSQQSWDDVVRLLGSQVGASASVRHTELTVGYRVPGPILDLANQLLVEVAPCAHTPDLHPCSGRATAHRRGSS